MVEEVRRASGGAVDAVIAGAGVVYMQGNEAIIRINYFGAVATLDGLRPLLAGGHRPRAVGIASRGLLRKVDDDVVHACLAGDEERAVDLALRPGVDAYATSKRALARWVRRAAPTPEWAGAGIPINAIGPGYVKTPMTDGVREAVAAGRIAHLLDYLTSQENTMVTGQVIFIDNGSDVVMRGDDIW